MIVQADILDWCKSYEGAPFHALLCDPPYHLSDPRDPARAAAKSPEERKAKGFMQMRWDGGDIAFRSETWAALAQHLHPGAFGMAFASTRGLHRMMVAIEDAGLILQPIIMCWGFGSGFPKATRIPDERFAGHRYGGQTLKPSLEPIVVWQKPYQGRPVDSITRTGAGALNIDAGRIALQPGDQKGEFGPHAPEYLGRKTTIGVYGGSFKRTDADNSVGRWPSSLLLVHSPACAAQCVEGCPIRVLGEQSGELTSGERKIGTPRNGKTEHLPGLSQSPSANTFAGSEGTAARYFFNGDYMYERMEAAAPFHYQAKASTSEREAGLSEWTQTTVDDGRQTPIDNPYLRGETQRRNTHSTVKPISLIKHLCSLLLAPVEYAPRRLLIPFAGVASEMIGAHLAGWEEMVGIEQDAGYVAIAQARLNWWQTAARRLMTTDVDTLLAMQEEAAQPNLFDLEDAA